MEVTVLVDGRPRIISGVTEQTTCRELVTVVARFRSQPGTYNLLLMRDSFNDGSGAVPPIFIPPDAYIVKVLRRWRHQVTSRPAMSFPADGCLVLMLQQPGLMSATGPAARRRRVILQMETKEQSARLRVVTRLAKQLEAENRSLLLEAESYGDESISPSKSLLTDEFNRVSQEVKELEQAGLPDLLMQQRDTERSLRSAIERYRRRIHEAEENFADLQSSNTAKAAVLNGHSHLDGASHGDTSVASVPVAQPVWV